MTDLKRACVYTCLIGAYENLNEQPTAANSKLPFVCLTDDDSFQSDTWRPIKVELAFPSDPVRSQRLLKLLPHRFLPEFDVSLYIDNTVLLTEKPEAVLERYLSSSNFALPTHSFRNTVADEFVQADTWELDDPGRLAEQHDHYQAEDPGSLLERPYWTGTLMRRHDAPDVQRALNTWVDHILRYSRRDQLSANRIFRQTNVCPDRIEIDNYKSWFHTWPTQSGRAPRRSYYVTPEIAAMRERASSLDKKLAQAVTRVRQQERRLDALREPIADEELPEVSGESSAWVRSSTGHKIYIDPNDDRAKELLKTNGQLNPNSTIIWQTLLEDGNWTHVIDVGANYGEMLLGVNLPDKAQINAFEPSPFLIPYLRRSLNEAGLDVRLTQQAVSSHVMQLPLSIDRNWSGLSSLAGPQPGSAGHQIEVIDVDTIPLSALFADVEEARAARVVLKVDVESHEIPVLKGLESVLWEFADFAAMIEISHLSVEDCEWLRSRFQFEMLNTHTKKLTNINIDAGHDLLLLGGEPRFYGNDIVLRRKRKAPRWYAQ
jgi:FkbM family methyltransferase